MDPDIPAPSVEDDLPDPPPDIKTTPSLSSPAIKVNSYDRTLSHPPAMVSPAKVPLPASSPMRAASYTPSSKPKTVTQRTPSRSPSVASSRGEAQSTPLLRRSASSLSNARGTTPQFRRASSNLNPQSPVPNGRMPVSERPPVTANSVAKEYFGKELEAHTTLQSPVVVIIHDSCYGHRFSRPRTSKNALSTIVERPERIHATVLGASTAYVRLGGRHVDGQYAPKPRHRPTEVRNVPFQIRKTSRTIPLTHPSVAFVHGAKWMEELQVMCDTAEGKLALNGKELVRPIGYGKDEAGNALPKLHEGDLYLCAASLAAFQGCLGGVCDAVDTVFSSPITRRAFVCIRPPGHHCSSNYPSGFCWLNNVHVGIAYASMNHGLTHAAIIDFDLHHGDGSQNIAWDQNRKAHGAAKNAAAHKKTPIGYYSLHDINSYPCEWGDEEKVQKASLCIDNAHGQSVWNVHLEPWKTHEEFWQLYESKYLVLLEKARLFLRQQTAKLRATGHQAKAAIFISAGFDASEWEMGGMQRHSVNVPTEFYARLTSDIARLAQEHDLGVDGRVISVLEGGYSDRALTSGSFSHICGLASDIPSPHDADASMANGGKYQTINNWVETTATQTTGYDANWWTAQNLEELEAVVAGRQRPVHNLDKDQTGNYASPTHASTSKMTNGARERQSLGALQARLSLEAEYEPPPPDVDWAIAAYELSRVIIPGDRQTNSCTHEELNAEATKARQKRQSNVGVAAPSEAPMQLRDRKAKVQAAGPPTVRAASRISSRRTTIAAVSDLADPTMGPPEMPARMRRRSSDASSILSSFQGMNLSDQKSDTAAFTNPASGPNSRAASVVPAQASKAVAVKKTRAPAAPKAPVRPKSPRKLKAVAPPVPTIPTGLQRRPSNEVQRSTSISSQGGSKATKPVDDLDRLTNGMQKISIKLRVPSAEDQAAKQHNGTDDKQKKPRAPRKPAVPKISKASEKPRPAAPTSSSSQMLQSPAQLPKTSDQPETLQANQSPHELAADPQVGITNLVKDVADSSLPVNDSAQPQSKQDLLQDLARAGPEIPTGAPTRKFGEANSFTERQATSRGGGLDFAHRVDLNKPMPTAAGFALWSTIPATDSDPPTQAHSGTSIGVHPLTGPTTPEPFAASQARPTQHLPSATHGIQQPSSAFDANPFAQSTSRDPVVDVPLSESQESTNTKPSTPTTPQQRTKQALPVFTSTSPIPFAQRENKEAILNNKEESTGKKSGSIWDIPETPHQE